VNKCLKKEISSGIRSCCIADSDRTDTEHNLWIATARMMMDEQMFEKRNLTWESLVLRRRL
jgi:hypothetical protein